MTGTQQGAAPTGPENESADQNEESDDLAGSPILCKTIAQNIRSVAQWERRQQRRLSWQDKAADAITNFSGSMAFVYLHIAFFAAWIIYNLGSPGHKPPDPYPFQLLTLIVSLEAIFLSTFVLISQNRQGEQASRRSQLDMHVGLLSEHEVTRLLRMVDAIHTKLGIVEEDGGDLVELESEVRPQDVLREIERIQHDPMLAEKRLARARLLHLGYRQPPGQK